MEKFIIGDFFIEEKEYQEIKKRLNKTTDYFSLEEINIICEEAQS